MKDASNELLKAARAALVGAAGLSAIGNRVFSSWDNQEEALPIIRMTIPNVRQYEIDGGGDGCEMDLNIAVFTTESAPIACTNYAAAIRNALDQAALALDTSDLIALDYLDTIRRHDDQSPLLQMAVLRFLAIATTK